jgi:hypothetical protein
LYFIANAVAYQHEFINRKWTPSHQIIIDRQQGRSSKVMTPEQTEAINVEPLDSMTSLRMRMAYWKYSTPGMTGTMDFSANAP